MENSGMDDQQSQQSEQDKIAAALSIWPAIARHNLRVGVGWAWDAEQQCHVERDGVVVYDTSEDENSSSSGAEARKEE